MERRLAAILAADVVGYSRLMSEDESGTLERLKSLRKDLVQRKITERKGRIVKLMGDGLLAEFPSVVEAVQCAVDIQEQITGREADLPDESRIRLRIGVNLGDIIVEGSDIYGNGVNVAARLEELAQPGGICISGAAKDQLSAKMNFAFEPLGTQQLKNILDPIAVYRLATRPNDKSASQPRGLHLDLRIPAKPSIAVLPFQNMSKDDEQEFFADGLTEDIITKLSYLRSLLVISRTSTFAYKGRAVRINDVANDLGVRYILEGSVRKVGTRVRITAQLIDALSGGHVWSQKYDRELTDIFAIQDEITRAIVISMQVKLTDGEAARLEAGGTRNIDAWESFLQGTQVLLEYTKESILNARRLFEVALDHDSNYLDAKTYLAWTHWIDARYGHVADRNAAIAKSHRLLEETKSGNVETPNAKHLEAAQYLLRRKHVDARQSAIAAFQLGPCMLFGYTPAAMVQMYCGDFQSSLDILRTTLRLSPFCPNDAVYYLAYASSWAGDHENAMDAAKEYGLRVPTDPYAYVVQSVAYAFAGRNEESRLAVDSLRKLYPTFTLKDFISHELYGDPMDLERVVTALRKAGLPE